jgi:hypothetical protein
MHALIAEARTRGNVHALVGAIDAANTGSRALHESWVLPWWAACRRWLSNLGLVGSGVLPAAAGNTAAAGGWLIHLVRGSLLLIAAYPSAMEMDAAAQMRSLRALLHKNCSEALSLNPGLR